MINLNQFSKGVTIPSDLIENAKRTVAVINEILAAHPQLRFTSGYRTPARNRAVGGVPTSYHVKALAGDVVTPDDKYPTALVESVRAIVAKHGYELLVHNVGSGNHIHIEPRPGGAVKKK